MKPSIVKGLSVLMLGLVIMLAAGRRAAAQPGHQASLLGTWRVQVTLVDCQTGTPLSPAFPSLVTFALGEPWRRTQPIRRSDRDNGVVAKGYGTTRVEVPTGQGAWPSSITRRRRIPRRTIQDLRRASRRSRKPSRSRMAPTHGPARRPSNLAIPQAPCTGKDVPWQAHSVSKRGDSFRNPSIVQVEFGLTVVPHGS